MNIKKTVFPLIKKNFSDTIGNTPLIKLKLASEISGCNIFGKCEFLNPGGSVKDRPAKQIIFDALDKKNYKGSYNNRRYCRQYRHRFMSSWKFLRYEIYYSHA